MLETIVPVQLGYSALHASNSLSKAVSPPVSVPVPSNSTSQFCVMVTSTVTLVLLGRLATDAANCPTVMLSGDSSTSSSTMASLTVNCFGAAGGGGGEGLGGGGDGGGGLGDEGAAAVAPIAAAASSSR